MEAQEKNQGNMNPPPRPAPFRLLHSGNAYQRSAYQVPCTQWLSVIIYFPTFIYITMASL